MLCIQFVAKIIFCTLYYESVYFIYLWAHFIDSANLFSLGLIAGFYIVCTFNLSVAELQYILVIVKYLIYEEPYPKT